MTAIAVISDLLRSVDLPLKKGSGLVLHRARISQSLLGLGDRRSQSTEIGFVGLAAQVQGDSVLNGLGMLVNLGLWTRKGLVDVVDAIRLAHQLERGPRQVCLVLILLNGFCLLQRGIELRIVGCVGRALLEETVIRGVELRQLRRVLLVLVLYAITVGVGHPVIQLSRIANAFKHPFSGAGRVVSYVTAHLHRVLRGRLIVAGIPFNSTDQARFHFFIRVGTNVVVGIDFHGEGSVLLQRVQRTIYIKWAFGADRGSSSACIDQLLIQIGVLLPDFQAIRSGSRIGSGVVGFHGSVQISSGLIDLGLALLGTACLLDLRCSCDGILQSSPSLIAFLAVLDCLGGLQGRIQIALIKLVIAQAEIALAQVLVVDRERNVLMKGSLGIRVGNPHEQLAQFRNVQTSSHGARHPCGLGLRKIIFSGVFHHCRLFRGKEPDVQVVGAVFGEAVVGHGEQTLRQHVAFRGVATIHAVPFTHFKLVGIDDLLLIELIDCSPQVRYGSIKLFLRVPVGGIRIENHLSGSYGILQRIPSLIGMITLLQCLSRLDFSVQRSIVHLRALCRNAPNRLVQNHIQVRSELRVRLKRRTVDDVGLLLAR